MNPLRFPLRVLRLALWLVLGVPVLANAAEPVTPPPPRVFLFDAATLQANRQRLRAGDTNLAPAAANLEREARKALAEGPFSVMDKRTTPPGGDKHDYMSFAPYYWPNPATSNGLPYVRHDGSRNPEARNFSDRRSLGSLLEAVETLSLAYYFTGDEVFAAKAAGLLRGWFLDPATRMNPHFEYAQAVPGVNSGRGTGLIETAGLTGLVDAVGLLAASPAWTAADQRGLQEWFSRFLAWMRDSEKGRAEAAARNNHGTYYDLQVASFALFVGQPALATNVLQAAGKKRIAWQIEPDGRQPLELARTNASGYSTMNLRGLMSLARLGEHVGVDLWHYETPDGRSICRALDYLLSFPAGERAWPYRTSEKPTLKSLSPLVRRAAARCKDERYRMLLAKVPAPDAADRSRLVEAQATPVLRR